MNRPHVTLKLATSLDGRIATARGESRWITGEAARAQVHQMRAAVDAVMIGIGTALADNPELTVRSDPPPARQPLRVVLDRRFRLSSDSHLASQAPPTLLISTTASSVDEANSALRASRAQLAVVRPLAGEGEVAAVLRYLGEHHSVGRVLLEGGGALAASALREGVVDRIEWFRAPIVLGEEGKAAIGALKVDQLADAPAWTRVAFRELGSDLWESYERR